MNIKVFLVFVYLTFICFNGISQLVFKSTFLNIKMIAKSDKSEYSSPSFTISYIIIGIDVDKIGIHIFDIDNYKTPIVLNQYKIINDPVKDGKTIYYTKEGNFLVLEPSKNLFIYQYDDDYLNYACNFEDIELSNETEYNNFANTFNIEDPSASNFSENDHNLIGYHKDMVVFKCSKNYKEPQKYYGQIEGVSTDNPALMFQDENNQYVVFIFNEKNICKSILYIYDNSYLDGLKKVFNQAYGLKADMKWIEHTDNCDYMYWIEKKLTTFILHIDKV